MILPKYARYETERQYSFDNFEKYDGSKLARASMELALKWSDRFPEMPKIERYFQNMLDMTVL